MHKSIIIALLLILATALACQNESTHRKRTDNDAELSTVKDPIRTAVIDNEQSVTGTESINVQDQIRSTIIDSEESARRAAVGIWTNSEPLNTMRQIMVGWNKIEIHPDGTFDAYSAIPTDDDWGKPENGRWKIFSGKYLNTGERYYGINWGNYWPIVFVDAQTANLTESSGKFLVTLHKGDVFPFSK